MPASKLGPSASPAPVPTPLSTAQKSSPNAGAPWEEPPSHLTGTLAINDEDAAKLRAVNVTPFGAQGASTPAPVAARPPVSGSRWTEREVPQAAYVPLAVRSRSQDEPAAASFSAPQPMPSPPPALSAPASAMESLEPPETLGEHFLAAMVRAGEGAG